VLMLGPAVPPARVGAVAAVRSSHPGMHPSIHIRVHVLVLSCHPPVILCLVIPSALYPVPSRACVLVLACEPPVGRLVELQAPGESGEGGVVGGNTVGVVSVSVSAWCGVVWYVGQWWVGAWKGGSKQVPGDARESTHTAEPSRRSSVDTLCLLD
jgi:hypothetical protein